MRHNVKGKKLDRTAEGRKALVQGMACALFDKGKIHTTLPKAKYLRSFAEKFITRAKDNTLANRRLLLSRLQNKEIVEKLLTEIGPKYKERNGGYTRIQKSYIRNGDVTQMAYISLVDDIKMVIDEPKAKTETKAKAKTSKTESSAKPKAKSDAKPKAKTVKKVEDKK